MACSAIIGRIESRKLFIFTAIRLEAQAVAKAFGVPLGRDLEPVAIPGCAIPVELHVIGMGAVKMPSGFTRQSVRGIIMAGLAGALDPSLRIGDVIVDGLPEGSLINPPFRCGPIHSASGLVVTSEQKAALYKQTRALAVEMEGQRVRSLATQIGVPFLAVRAISDIASESLDPAVLNLVDDLGRPKPAAIAAALLRRPTMAPYLSRLGAASRLAADKLAAALQYLLTSEILERWLHSPE